MKIGSLTIEVVESRDGVLFLKNSGAMGRAELGRLTDEIVFLVEIHAPRCILIDRRDLVDLTSRWDRVMNLLTMKARLGGRAPRLLLVGGEPRRLACAEAIEQTGMLVEFVKSLSAARILSGLGRSIGGIASALVLADWLPMDLIGQVSGTLSGTI